jgi:hypothetical protein
MDLSRFRYYLALTGTAWSNRLLGQMASPPPRSSRRPLQVTGGRNPSRPAAAHLFPAPPPRRPPRPPPDKAGVADEGGGGDLLPLGAWLGGAEGVHPAGFRRSSPVVLLCALCPAATLSPPRMPPAAGVASTPCWGAPARISHCRLCSQIRLDLESTRPAASGSCATGAGSSPPTRQCVRWGACGGLLPRSCRPRSRLPRASAVDGLCVGSVGWCLGWTWCSDFGLFCYRRRVCPRLCKVDSGQCICGQCDSPCRRGRSRGSQHPPLSLSCDTLGLLCCRLVNFPTKNTVSNCLPPDGEEGPCRSVSLGVSLLLWCGLVLHSLFGVAAPSARLLWWVRRMVAGEIPARFSGADDDDICGCHSPPWRRRCATFFSSPWSLVCG